MKILNYFGFIFESNSNVKVPLILSNEFNSILKDIDSPLSKDFINLSGIESDISLINRGHDSDSVSFTTANKLSEHFKTKDLNMLNLLIKPLKISSSEIYSKNRTFTKIGRLVKKLLGSKYNDSEIEKFVNQYKSILDNKKLNFEIWKSNKIIEAYNSENYTEEGSLLNQLSMSCMNDLFDLIEFYTYIPVEVLVLIDQNGDIFGRALIWKTDKGFFMDRIYTVFDYDYYKFINFAKDHDIIYKAENKSGAKIEYVKDGVKKWFPMKINLKFDIMKYNKDEFAEEPKNIPYMDTFIYGQGNNLFNYEPLDDKYLILQDTEGIPIIFTPFYDIYGARIEDIDNYVFSKTQDGWIYFKEARWLESEKDYFSYDYLDNLDNGFIWSDSLNNYIKKID
jgi:hypothetical protein